MNERPVIAYVGFGSNLGDRQVAWTRTLDLLEHASGIRVIQAAQPIETDPVGPIQDQPRYLNSVIKIETTLTPLVLLDTLLDIEHQMGRVRRERWGPRTVDLDILLYGDEKIDLPQLKIPHPEIENRPFMMNLLEDVGAGHCPRPR
jgi:2-amino-4-hydroxy-6-hydroxymethyldihydropteridine diphosphokinase